MICHTTTINPIPIILFALHLWLLGCISHYALPSFARRNEGLQGSQESDWWISLDIFPENGSLTARWCLNAAPGTRGLLLKCGVNKCASIHSLSDPFCVFLLLPCIQVSVSIDGSHVLHSKIELSCSEFLSQMVSQQFIRHGVQSLTRGPNNIRLNIG